MKISKTLYLHIFTAIVMVLALYRCAHDMHTTGSPFAAGGEADTVAVDTDVVIEPPVAETKPEEKPSVVTLQSVEKPRNWHRINSVPSYKDAFPDSNEVQLVSARKYGVKPVRNRADAEKRKTELVYAGANPYFHVDRLRESIPYMVPRASILLQDIGRAFYDSLYVKGVPLHKIIVTSILRSEEDVERLRRHNLNASDNSCHRFGTTFDICYNRYMTVQTADQPRRQVQNDTLKWVLSEVLRDMREAGRCYIKYEVKQGCFHITTR
ncbi:MAG: hypothetical protein IJ782_03630 [Prevotella sp.]|nr:hypothetical protein [Prevotella sp.]